jgi:hypothetical protein
MQHQQFYQLQCERQKVGQDTIKFKHPGVQFRYLPYILPAAAGSTATAQPGGRGSRRGRPCFMAAASRLHLLAQQQQLSNSSGGGSNGNKSGINEEKEDDNGLYLGSFCWKMMAAAVDHGEQQVATPTPTLIALSSLLELKGMPTTHNGKASSKTFSVSDLVVIPPLTQTPADCHIPPPLRPLSQVAVPAEA